MLYTDVYPLEIIMEIVDADVTYLFIKYTDFFLIHMFCVRLYVGCCRRIANSVLFMQLNVAT